MPRFNLDNYDEVKDRLPLFYEQFPDGPKSSVKTAQG